MDLEEFYGYKNRLMEDLCTDEQIVKLVTGNEKAAVPNHDLPYTQIFPWENVPDTVDVAKTFVCFDADIVAVPNKTIYLPVLYVWVFTHKSRYRDRGGLMIDKLSARINKILNGNRFYGMGELKLDSVRRFYPTVDYMGRVLTYAARDFNKATNPRVPLPSNRVKDR